MNHSENRPGSKSIPAFGEFVCLGMCDLEAKFYNVSESIFITLNDNSFDLEAVASSTQGCTRKSRERMIC